MGGRALMLQGCGSDVGKSTLVAGLCRIAMRRGVRVAPFKPQNMSNNAAATEDGGEVGRAQALQARAAGLSPRTDFNPVLLKPQSDRTAQVVVHGQVRATLEAADYMARRDSLMGAVLQSFGRLREEFELVLVEGAGSPAEINLRARDVANMGFARAADVPVVLVGDIDKGGVIASIVGTQAVLDPDDAVLIKAFIVNKFRGDPALFDDGMSEIVRRTGWASLGLVPWLASARALPAEDAVVLERPGEAAGGRIVIAAPMLSRIANFDDADPLRAEPGVDFRFVPPGQPMPRDADVILLLGTKSTRADLEFLRTQGWDIDIQAHARQGGRVFGLCGGYQMMGRLIADPDGIDGAAGESVGLGLLEISTRMEAAKRIRQVHGAAYSGEAVAGYEIHAGRTEGPDVARPFLTVVGVADGARSADGRMAGCYMHGLFDSDAFRHAWLDSVKIGAGSDLQYDVRVEQALDGLADELERSLDIEALFALAR